MTSLNHVISRILAAQMASLPTTTANIDATQVAVEPTKLGREEILARLTKLASPDGSAIRQLDVDMQGECCTLNFIMDADGRKVCYQLPCIDEQLLRLLASRAKKFSPEELGAKLRQPH